jgi:hypothetical protein
MDVGWSRQSVPKETVRDGEYSHQLGSIGAVIIGYQNRSVSNEITQKTAPVPLLLKAQTKN